MLGELQRLGKYRIEGMIGQGSMGVVYKGFDEDIARPVALKVLHRHLVGGDVGDEMSSRFRQEARAAARCLHGNIVTVFDYGVTDEAQFIAMEFVHGTDLRSLLKQVRRLPYHQAMDVIRQVLRALDYAHDNGVVHRDIKPANIMVLLNGTVKVADFGIAKLDTSDITNVGVVIGTPSYMSPEGRLGQAVDFRSDLYSAGIVLFELITGIRPMPTDDILKDLQATLFDHIRDRKVSDEVTSLLRRVLEPQRETRIPSAREFLFELERIGLPDMDGDVNTQTLVQTVVNSGIRAPAPTLSGSGESSHTHEFPATVIERVLQGLKPFLGPMAERLVRRYAQSCTSVPELINELSTNIPNDTERNQFLKSVNVAELSSIDTAGSHPSKAGTVVAAGSGSGSAPSTPSAPSGTAGSLTLNEDVMAAVNKLLAGYVGPLATHISRRASKKAGSWTAFGDQLAAEIPNERERAAFLERFAALKK